MTTQPRVASLIPRAAWALGSVRLMIEVSSTTISVAAAITTSAHHRRGSTAAFSPVAVACGALTTLPAYG